jgi:2-haloacid dehalogenase
VTRRVVVFDLGGVLLDWNPRHLYRKLFDDEASMESFLTDVCSPAWNERQDAGRPFHEAVAELAPKHPDKLHLINAWRERFSEMIPGPLAGTVDILRDLVSRNVPVYALSNWSAETFPSQKPRFPFLDWFHGVVLSGAEGCIKPDERIFRILLDRYGLTARETVFIDDNPKNAQAASPLGIHGIHFQSPGQLRRELAALGFFDSDTP